MMNNAKEWRESSRQPGYWIHATGCLVSLRRGNAMRLRDLDHSHRAYCVHVDGRNTTVRGAALWLSAWGLAPTPWARGCTESDRDAAWSQYRADAREHARGEMPR